MSIVNVYNNISTVKELEFTRRIDQLENIIEVANYIDFEGWNFIFDMIKYINSNKLSLKKILYDSSFNKFILNINTEIIQILESGIVNPPNQTLTQFTAILNYALLLNVQPSFTLIKFTNDLNHIMPGTANYLSIKNNNIFQYPLKGIENIFFISVPMEPFNEEISSYDTRFEFSEIDWLNSLEEALKIIELDPVAFELLSSYTTYIYPLASRNDSINFSFTSNLLPKTIFKDRETNSLLFCESLIHESDHSFFYELENLFPLWISKEESERLKHYSPWRQDPRPLVGLFRGLSAFTRVSMFYFQHLSNFNNNIDHNEFTTLVYKIEQCKVAAETLSLSNILSTHGRALLDELCSTLNSIELNISGENCYSEAYVNASIRIQNNKSKYASQKHERG